MAAEWYVKIADKEATPPIWSTVGPLSAQQLRAMAGKGEISPEDLVRQGAEGRWVPVARVKGLLIAADSASHAPAEEIPVAKLLPTTDTKSSKTKTPATAAVHKKKRSEFPKTAKAIEEPATVMNLPPVVAKGPVPPPVPPPPPVPVPPLAVASAAEAPAADEAAASPPAAPAPEAEPPTVPHSRHSPGIDLPFDVSPAASSGSHAAVAAPAEKTSGSSPGKAPAAKEKPKFQINYTIVAVAVVVVVAAGLFIFVSMSGGDNKGKGKTAAGTAPDKSAEETKESPTPPDADKKKPDEKKIDTSISLEDMLLKGGKPVGPSKPATPAAKPDEKKPDAAPKDKWFDASKEPAVGKNVSIKVKSAKLGKFIPQSRTKIGDGLLLTLLVTNTVKERRLKCQWELLKQPGSDSTLVDSFDQPNTYALKRILPKSQDPIDPDDSMDVDLIFEKPIKTAKYVRLKLPGAIFGEPDFIRIEIPKEMITQAEENGGENPAPEPPPPVDANKPPPTDQPKPIPGVNGPEVPDIGLPALPSDSRSQPRGGRDVELADAELGRPAAVRERRISDFDDDPATVDRYGQPSPLRDPDRRGSRRAAQR
jgi:hypothetical protein